MILLYSTYLNYSKIITNWQCLYPWAVHQFQPPNPWIVRLFRYMTSKPRWCDIISSNLKRKNMGVRVQSRVRGIGVTVIELYLWLVWGWYIQEATLKEKEFNSQLESKHCPTN